MQIDENELRRRLDSSNNLANIIPLDRSRVKAPNLSEKDREVVARLAVSGEHTQEEIGAAFGIDQSTVSQQKTGHVGGRPPDAERRAKREEILADAKDTALSKLMLSLGLIDQDKLLDSSAKDLSTIAGNMAKIHQNLSNQTGPQGPAISITVYAPEQRSVDRYKVVES